MTERVKGVTVVLDKDIRIDDIEPLLQAIRMLKGVALVEPVIREGTDGIVQVRTKTQIAQKLYEFIETELR